MTPMHRVIPVREAVASDARILPHEEARSIITQARSWGVRECICRKQKQLVGEGCQQPLELCLVFSDRENAFVTSEMDRPITREESLRLLQQAENLGLVHSIGNYRGRHEYICNCCACCCGIMRGALRSGHPSVALRADFWALMDAEACVGCETCLDRCPMGALSVPDDICVVDGARCIGCGVCASVCPSNALSLVRRIDTDQSPLPEDLSAWTTRRAEKRGVPLDRRPDLPWAPIIQPPVRE